MSSGGVELDRTVASIRVGYRVRHELGDLDELRDSIDQLGLLQPITITPDGTLVCGARRLAAVKQLGWERVKVWITSTVSTRLAGVLAEQHENTARKELTPTEAAALYSELKQLYAEDAARRQQATQFTTARNPRHQGGSDGPADSAAPSAQDKTVRNAGDTRRQAARAITGRSSYWSLEHVTEVQHLAADSDAPEWVRALARRELAAMDEDGKVHGHYLTVQAATHTDTLARLADDPAQPETVRARAADELNTLDRTQPAAELVRAAQAAIARATNPAGDGADGLRLVKVRHYGLRAFLATMDEMDGWWNYYDPAEIAAGLSDEQWDQLSACLEATAAFIRAIGDARHHGPPSEPLADRPPHAASF